MELTPPPRHAVAFPIYDRLWQALRPELARALPDLAVARGDADLPCIDLVTWRLLLAENDPVALALKVIERTRPTPAHPIITAPGRDPAPVFPALTAALATLPLSDRQTIGLTRLLPADAAQYYAIPLPPKAPGDQVS